MLNIPFLTGKIKLDIGNKREFSRGEIIKGKVYLTLKKNVKARGVKVRLIAEREERKMERDRVETYWKEFYRQEVELDEEKEYQKGDYEYEFEIKIPKNIPPTVKPPAFSLSLSGMLNLLGTPRPIRWKIAAVLDIPLGFDISDKKDIVIV